MKMKEELSPETTADASPPLKRFVIPQNASEKQAWFIITAMRNMDKDEIEMLCKNLLARYDINLPRLIQHVEQIKDKNLTV